MSLSPIGSYVAAEIPPAFTAAELIQAVARVREPAFVIQDPQSRQLGVGIGGGLAPANGTAPEGYALLGVLPALYPEWLGDRSFGEVHGVRFPYVGGAMANGIATAKMVIALARSGMIGFFGAGGLSLEEVEHNIVVLSSELDGARLPYGSNLVFTPTDPARDLASVELLLRHGVRRMSASAFMKITPAVVRFACAGLALAPDGTVMRTHHVFAKLSRPEIAEQFMSPPPAAMLQALVEQRLLTADEANLGARLPIAEDITVEADSGGHTDNRPLGALLPVIQRLRDRLTVTHGYPRPIRVGAAGGLGDPRAVAAAFGAGAAYVLIGSVHQVAVESGISARARELLDQAGIADFAMAPSPDMFELGVKVQVLARGTMFARHAAFLYRLYTTHQSLAELDGATRERLETRVLKRSIDAVYEETRAYFLAHDPRELERADADPHHHMALIFRWYLGLSSRWAINGVEDRVTDYQIWSGPAIAAFNDWTGGSLLATPAARTVGQIARNLLEGAAVVTRAQQLRSYGVPVPPQAFDFRPRPLC